MRTYLITGVVAAAMGVGAVVALCATGTSGYVSGVTGASKKTTATYKSTTAVSATTPRATTATQPRTTTRTTMPPAPPTTVAAASTVTTVAGPVTPPRLEIDATARDWKPWDADAAARAKDDRFNVAKGVVGAKLASQELVAMVARMPALEEGIAAKDAVTADERASLKQGIADTDKVFYPTRRVDDATADPALPAINAKLLARVDSEDFSRQEAEELYAQMLRVHRIKLYLARAKDIPEDKRTGLSQEYNTLDAILHQ